MNTVPYTNARREGRTNPGLIEFIGEIGDHQKSEFLGGADALLFPIDWPEPFGLVMIEAMACGTPVVASAVGGIKEVVVPEETGLLVPVEQMAEAPYEPVDPERFSRDLAAGLNRLMADPALRGRMGEAGRKRAVEVFSWASIARQTADLYRSLVP